MRQAGTLDSQAQAQRLSDYLLTQKIASRVEPENGRWAVWILDENQLDRARQETRDFQEHPDDARYDAACQPAAELRRQEAERVRAARKNVVEVRDQWARVQRRSPRLTIAIAALAIGAALVTHLGEDVRTELLGQKPPGLASLLLISTNVNAPLQDLLAEPDFGLTQIAHGEVWRLITPIFLHFGIPHIVFNIFAWFELAGALERIQGTLRLALLMLISAVLSNLCQYFWNGPIFGGLSGVVYAVFGYIWMQSKYVPGSGLYMPPQMVVVCVVWFFLCLFNVVEHVANGAHTAGLITGMILGVLPRLWKR